MLSWFRLNRLASENKSITNHQFTPAHQKTFQSQDTSQNIASFMDVKSIAKLHCTSKMFYHKSLSQKILSKDQEFEMKALKDLHLKKINQLLATEKKLFEEIDERLFAIKNLLPENCSPSLDGMSLDEQNDLFDHLNAIFASNTFMYDFCCDKPYYKNAMEYCLHASVGNGIFSIMPCGSTGAALGALSGAFVGQGGIFIGEMAAYFGAGVCVPTFLVLSCLSYQGNYRDCIEFRTPTTDAEIQYLKANIKPLISKLKKTRLNLNKLGHKENVIKSDTLEMGNLPYEEEYKKISISK